MGHLGLWEVLFSWNSDLVWAPGSLSRDVRLSHSVGQGHPGLVWAPGSLSGDVRLSHSVGQGHPGLWGVLVSGYLDLVWAQDLPSGVV